MRCTLYFAFAAITQAASILITPIPVTGGGHWWYDHTIGGGEGWSVSFSGSLDGRFVSLSGNCNSPLSWCGLDNLFLPAQIDGAYFHFGFVRFALGSQGSITGHDAQGGTMTEAINGVWTETSRVCYAAWECEGGFAIVPAPITSNPEPGSIAMVAAGLGISAIRKRRRQREW